MTTTIVVRPIQPAAVVRSPSTTVVAVPPAPQRVVHAQETVVSVDSAPAVVVVDDATRERIAVGAQGPRGPVGPKGDPGDISGTTDQLVEGATNLYYTDARAALAAPVQSVNTLTGDVVLAAADVGADPEGTAIAAANSALSTHLADPDPHAQYRKKTEPYTLDGGNF